jgi:peptide/nickel transport system permease protein
MSLLRYALLRLLSGALLVVASAVAIFLVMRLLGNPIAIALSGRVSEEDIALRIEAAGLNRPLELQLFEYLGQLLRGSFGETTLSSQDVSQLIWASLPASLEFGFLALLFAAIVSVPIGFFAARNAKKVRSEAIRISAIVFYAIPIFLFALLLKIVFTVWIPLFPVAGRTSVNSQIVLQSQSPNTGFILFDALSAGYWPAIPDYFLHMALPVLAVGLVIAASLIRAIRVTVLEQLSSDWYLEARNKFGDNRQTAVTHLLRPSLAAIITSFGSQAIVVLTGLVLAEQVFEIRGLGYLLTEAVLSRDYNLVQGVVVVIAMIVIAINLVNDLVAAAIDPRFRKLVR